MTSPDPPLRANLQDALGDAYTIERELGGGGEVLDDTRAVAWVVS